MTAKQSPTQGSDSSFAFELLFPGLYALLLALVITRHAMNADEMQAWLIARDSNSLSALFHNMRYEGHPLLWHLLLFIPAHISWNPVSMQVINYVFAVTEAWLILSARELHRSIRVMTVFSFFVFYQYGVYARNYMLAMLLLTAAARCLLEKPKHRKLAILFLALSINTHFFAIPIAAVLAIQLFLFPKIESWRSSGDLLRDRQVQGATVALLLSLLAAYFSLRPPADVYVPAYALQHSSLAYYVASTVGEAWGALIPANHATANVYGWLGSHHHVVGPTAVFSLAFFVIVGASFRTIQARCFFLIASTFEMIAMAVTVHRPNVHHLGMIFVVLVLAFFIDAHTTPNTIRRAWFPQPIAFVVIFVILGLQTLKAAKTSWSQWSRANSAVTQTSSWLRQTGLDKDPMVLERYDNDTVLLGYLQKRSAYYPACGCIGSFIVLRARRDGDRVVSEEELENFSRSSRLPVILVSQWELPLERLQSLRFRELRTFRGVGVSADGSFEERSFVYQRSAP